MQSELVLVTGAAGGKQGQTGRYVSEQLLAKGISVRAFVRKIDDRSERLRALGADVIVGDFHDYHSVERATQGVSAIYFAYPVQEGLLQATTIMADAARKAGVTRLVDLVMLVSSPDAPTPRMRENYFSERIFEWAGIGASHVRAAIFYENLRALTAGTIPRDGSIMLPWGDESTVVPLVAAEDVARVAVGVLMDPSVTPNSSFPVIGEILHLRDIIDVFERVLERKVRYQDITDEAWADHALSRSANQHAVEHLSKLWQRLRKGVRIADLPDTILKITGKRPQTFEDFLRRQKHVFAPQPIATV
ncbi:MAG TPA: NmrA family NAD(P)-binding protein [Steroidobacteraceae bacterium]